MNDNDKLIKYVRFLEQENAKLRQSQYQSDDNDPINTIKALEDEDVEIIILTMNDPNSSSSVQMLCKNELRKRGYNPDIFDANANNLYLR